MAKSSIDEKTQTNLSDAKIIGRLASENAELLDVIENAKVLIERTIMDASKLSLLGAIALLLKENKLLAETVKRYEK